MEPVGHDRRQHQGGGHVVHQVGEERGEQRPCPGGPPGRRRWGGRRGRRRRGRGRPRPAPPPPAPRRRGGTRAPRPASSAVGRARRRATATTATTAAPPSAIQAGAMPSAEPTKNATVSAAIAATTNQAKPSSVIGSCGLALGELGAAVAPHRGADHDRGRSKGRAAPCAAAKPPKLRPVAENTRRLVRFDTGRKLDDALASWVVASSGGSEPRAALRDQRDHHRREEHRGGVEAHEHGDQRPRPRRPRARAGVRCGPARPSTRPRRGTGRRRVRPRRARTPRRGTRAWARGGRGCRPPRRASTSPVATTSTAPVPATSRSGTRPHATNPSTATSTSRLPAVPTGPIPYPKGRCARQGRGWPEDVVAVLGGGQLGRMLALAGIPLDVRLPLPRPGRGRARGARSATWWWARSATRPRSARWRSGATVVTYEWEGVPADAARFLAAAAPRAPGARSLEVAQDRLTEKETFRRLGIATPAFAAVDDRAELDARGRRGRWSAGGAEDAAGRLRRQGPARAASTPPTSTPRGPSSAACRCILESLVPFDRELSVLAVRGLDGEVACWPLVENHHEGGILRVSRAPARGVDAALQARGEDARRRACSTTSTTSACSRSSCSTWAASCSPTRSRPACTTRATGRSRARTPASSRTTCARCSGGRSARPPLGPERDAQLHRRDARTRRGALDPRRAPPRLRQGAAPRPQARARHRHRRRRRRARRRRLDAVRRSVASAQSRD